MRTLTLALLLLLIPSCSDLGDDDVSSVEQAVSIAALPELLMIAPLPSPTQGLSWTAFGAVWSVGAYDPATTVTSYRPNPDQITNIGFSAYATGPGVPTCTRIGTTHSFSCSGTTIQCPSAALTTLPLQWNIGGTWHPWSDSGSENWLRVNAVGLVPTSSSVQRINDRSVIFCYHDRAGKVYQIKHR